MRYHVVYLRNGERFARDLEARDAATAVALVAQGFDPRATLFELLSVVPDAGEQGWDDQPSGAVGAPGAVRS